MSEKDMQEALVRLRRVEGQIRGVQRMIEENRACEDVVVQLMAIRAAVEKVATGLVNSYLDECLTNLPADEVRAAVSRAVDSLTKIG